MSRQRLSFFKYQFDKGPVALPALSETIAAGNCRLALQDFFYVFGQKYFAEHELLNPEGYLKTGSFLKQGSGEDFFEGVPTGAVIYAERIKNKKGELVDKSSSRFAHRDEYLVALHAAIYVHKLTEAITKKLPVEIRLPPDERPALWHATAIAGETCLWPVKKFCEYYKPVAAKQFVQLLKV